MQSHFGATAFFCTEGGTKPRSRSGTRASHTAGTEQSASRRVSAVSASRGEESFAKYKAEQLSQTSPEQHTPPSAPKKDLGLDTILSLFQLNPPFQVG